MHELPVIEEILAVVLTHAHRHGVSRVVTINLEVGSFSDLEDAWLQRYFDHCSRGSVAENARLELIRVPATGTCRRCNHVFTLAAPGTDKTGCPLCGAVDIVLDGRRGYHIASLEAL
ncbi:MAG: hydrogenase maturation nickel metallochaperone HypA [Deltaproteobacteria bacterium]|nr:hydrogenase maturation nickel metallochaperone HypA [Candidatus Anaeroferrophillacea bacterium]